MSSHKKMEYTASIDVDSNAIGFVLGKGKKNINDLKLAYPDVNVWMTQNGAYATFNLASNSATKLDLCRAEMEKLKYKGESNYESVVQRKRIVKNIEAQRQKIMASKKIRDTLENEMKTKHRDEVQKKIVSNLEVKPDGNDIGELDSFSGNNRFGGLELE